MPDSLHDLAALVQDVNLVNVVFLDVSARREDKTLDSEAFEEVLGGAVEPEYELASESDEGGTRMRIRVRVSVATDPGPIRVEAAAEYRFSERTIHDFDRLVVQDFAQQVGFMAVVPYLREAVGSLTQRVFGAALLMPMIKREDMTLERVEPSEEFESQDEAPVS